MEIVGFFGKNKKYTHSFSKCNFSHLKISYNIIDHLEQKNSSAVYSLQSVLL